MGAFLNWLQVPPQVQFGLGCFLVGVSFGWGVLAVIEAIAEKAKSRKAKSRRGR